MVAINCCVKDCYFSKLSKHRFPNPKKYIHIFKKWVLLCGNKELLEKTADKIYTNSRVCADHFLPCDFGRNSKLLNTAIPSLNLPEPLETKDNPIWVNVENMGDTNNGGIDKEAVEGHYTTNQTKYHRMAGLETSKAAEGIEDLFKNSKQSLCNTKNKERPGLTSEAKLPPQTRKPIPGKLIFLQNNLPSTQKTESAMDHISKDIILEEISPLNKFSMESFAIGHELCRLCLEKAPTMWSFFSVFTFEDESSLDVVQAFQYLTGESTQQIENPKLPKQICKRCVDLILNAYSFRHLYEKSYQTLIEFLSKELEDENQDVNNHELSCDDAETTAYEDTKFRVDSEDPDKTSTFLEVNVVSADRPLVPTGTKMEDLNITLSITDKKTGIGGKKKVETVQKLHRCPICMKQFTALDLKQHCRSHQALKKYLNAAPRFNKKIRFYAKPRTKNVCLFYRDNITHSCPFCAEEFNGEQFREHVKHHQTEGNFRCNICNRIFLGRNHLKMHQLSHRQEAPFKCKECGKEFFMQKNFDFHKLKHTTSSDDLPFKCHSCPRTFSNPEHLKRHTFSHEKFVSYQQYYRRSQRYVNCKQCLQKFKTLDELGEHNCKLCCAKCHKIFDSKKKFSSHVCKYRLKPSQCGSCTKVFQLSSSYKSHKYRCNYRTLCYICGNHVTNMTQHLQRHYPQKRSCFTCAQCGKKFRLRETLKRHITEVHMNVISFHCQYCAKGFKSKWNLVVHERIHLGVRKHVCSICHKSFLEKSYLKKHFRVHLRKDGLLVEETDNLNDGVKSIES